MITRQAKKRLNFPDPVKLDSSTPTPLGESKTKNGIVGHFLYEEDAPKIFRSPVSTCSTWQGRLRSRPHAHQTFYRSRGRKRRSYDNTSDYGTASENSSVLKSVTTNSEVCHCEELSGVSSICTDFSARSVESEDSDCIPLSQTGWDTDSEEEVPVNQWDMILDSSEIGFRTMKKGGVTVIVPNSNPSGYTASEFELKIINDLSYNPQKSLRIHHVGPVVSVEPHGAQFYKEIPATILLPVFVSPKPSDELICLFSNTSTNQQPVWERLPSSCFQYHSGRIMITSQHFSLFTVILQERYPEVKVEINPSIGGKLRTNEVPGVDVSFPRNSLAHNIEACLKVFYDSDLTQQSDSLALASPIIMVTPHGYHFDLNRPRVTVTLPIPLYSEVKKQGHRARLSLSIWQSCTTEFEPFVWEQLDVQYVIQRDRVSRLHVVTFPVTHFSFFKAMWNTARAGINIFTPYNSFPMMCEVFMSATDETNTFGLEVVIYRNDQKPNLSSKINRVCSSNAPQMIRSGKVFVRLQSDLFEADREAGEDTTLLQEQEFRGQYIEKHFALRFKDNNFSAKALFGKVIVERGTARGSPDIEQVFQMNLQKGEQPTMAYPMMCEAYITSLEASSLQFGLQVIFFRSDKKNSGYGNRQTRVCASATPLQVHAGKVVFKLHSDLFEADKQVGEDPSLVQEAEFKGQNVEKQYACRFKDGVIMPNGPPFGKLLVERVGFRRDQSDTESIFTMNLQKSGFDSADNTPSDTGINDQWAIPAIRDLAGHLRVSEGKNWITLAKKIGFTSSEIKLKLRYSADPLIAMINLYEQRHGTPEEFMQALHETGREIELGLRPEDSPASSSRSGGTQESPSPSASGSNASGGFSPARRAFFPGLVSLTPWKRRERDEDEESNTSRPMDPPPPKRRRNELSKDGGGSGAKKRPRRNFSDASETITSSSDEEMDHLSKRVKVNATLTDGPSQHQAQKSKSSDQGSVKKMMQDSRPFEQNEFWPMSNHIKKVDWKALGRTLGIEEAELVNIQESYKQQGSRECAYQMLIAWKSIMPRQCTVGHLHSALRQENMGEVSEDLAKFHKGTS